VIDPPEQLMLGDINIACFTSIFYINASFSVTIIKANVSVTKANETFNCKNKALNEAAAAFERKNFFNEAGDIYKTIADTKEDSEKANYLNKAAQTLTCAAMFSKSDEHRSKLFNKSAEIYKSIVDNQKKF